MVQSCFIFDHLFLFCVSLLEINITAVPSNSENGKSLTLIDGLRMTLIFVGQMLSVKSAK